MWHRDVPQEKLDVLINPDARTPEEMFANEVAGKPFPVLKEVKSKEVGKSGDGQTHLLIEGDNYHALAVLNFTHQESIDVIYIDPPYNTGNNDFIYTDNFGSDYVKKDDPFRHSKWLSFMEKRLKLAKNLLKETGVIFISIDDNEQAPLKMLCDEIFEERNFIGIISVVNNWKGRSDDKHIATTHEYLLVYGKKEDEVTLNGIELSEEKRAEYKHKDKYGLYKEVGFRKTGKGWQRKARPNMFYPIYFDPKTNKISLNRMKNYIEIYPRNSKGEDGRWRWGKETFLKKYKKDIVIRKTKTGKYSVYTKMRLKDEGIERTLKPKSTWIDPRYDSGKGTALMKDMFGEEVFENPKPLDYIKDILKISTNPDSIILDFMAGSGTTGHAVLELNKEDGGNRQFILCTNNENNICTDVCYPRLKKVIKGYKNAKGEKVEGLGENLKYFTAYDFVESEPTDRNKRKLVNKSTEMICIKEGVFDFVDGTDEYKIFKNPQGKYLGIVFYDEAIDEYKKAIKKIKQKVHTYVFSLNDNPHKAEFEDVKDKVVLHPIPEVILRVYKEIFK